MRSQIFSGSVLKEEFPVNNWLWILIPEATRIFVVFHKNTRVSVLNDSPLYFLLNQYRINSDQDCAASTGGALTHFGFVAVMTFLPADFAHVTAIILYPRWANFEKGMYNSKVRTNHRWNA